MRSIEPFYIYLIGEDHQKKTSSYVCTFLSQLQLYQRYNPDGTYDRVHVFWGKNGNPHEKCHHPKYKHPLQDRTISPSVPVQFLSKNDTLSTFRLRIRNVLEEHCIPQWTPIIVLYDGHGFLDRGNVEIGSTKDKSIIGNMIMTPEVTLTDNFWAEVLAPYRENPKFMLFSQCGSLDMGLRLLPQITNAVILTSTTRPNVCSYGASIFRKLEGILEFCASNHLTSFQDIQLLVTANNLSYLSRGVELQLSYFYPHLSPNHISFPRCDQELRHLFHLILDMPEVDTLSSLFHVPSRKYWNNRTPQYTNRLTLFFTMIGEIAHRNKVSCLLQALHD